MIENNEFRVSLNTAATSAGKSETLVRVERGGLERVGEWLVRWGQSDRPHKIAIVTDSTVASLYGGPVADSLRAAGLPSKMIQLPPGESSKSFQTLELLFDGFARAELSRDGLVLALGGGVVSDVAGFAAATWMRGVEFAICPTTLEAQIDAAIGGKTAINISRGKNLVGAFHPASFVLIDPACLDTLDKREVRAGLAESIKHALITSEEFLSWHEANAAGIVELKAGVIDELVRRNVAIKAAIVGRDPLETTGERRVLNFGHTLGHAIENASGYSLRHGECVGLGMLAACRISNRMTGLPEGVTTRVEKLLGSVGLPTRVPISVDAEQLFAALRQDKKSKQGSVQFVLLVEVGRSAFRGDVSETLVQETLARS